VQWPVEEIETLQRRRADAVGAEVEAGGLREIGGVESSQADVDVVFEVPSLERAEGLDPSRLLDADALCGEKGASVRGEGRLRARRRRAVRPAGDGVR
jgi:beta-fructofuranosidase